MSQQTFGEPIDAAIAEYLATFESYWKPKTNAKYRAELRDLCTWLATDGRPLTTASLDYTTLLAYVGHPLHSPDRSGHRRPVLGHNFGIASPNPRGNPIRASVYWCISRQGPFVGTSPPRRPRPVSSASRAARIFSYSRSCARVEPARCVKQVGTRIFGSSNGKTTVASASYRAR